MHISYSISRFRLRSPTLYSNVFCTPSAQTCLLGFLQAYLDIRQISYLIFCSHRKEQLQTLLCHKVLRTLHLVVWQLYGNRFSLMYWDIRQKFVKSCHSKKSIFHACVTVKPFNVVMCPHLELGLENLRNLTCLFKEKLIWISWKSNVCTKSPGKWWDI